MSLNFLRKVTYYEKNAYGGVIGMFLCNSLFCMGSIRNLDRS